MNNLTIYKKCWRTFFIDSRALSQKQMQKIINITEKHGVFFSEVYFKILHDNG